MAINRAYIQGRLPYSGTTAENAALIGSYACLSADMDRMQIRLHDATTSGGHLLGADSVSITALGAVGDNETDCTDAIQEAVELGDNIAIEIPSGTFVINDAITYPTTATRITMWSRSGGAIRAAHTGNAIVATTANENYGQHAWDGIRLVGANNWNQNTYTNIGAAIRMHSGDTNAVAGYRNVIRDCDISGFRYGLALQAVIGLQVEGRTFIRHNEYGVWVDGGQTNVNNFIGTVLTYNKIAGVYSTGAYAASDATANYFRGCLIESNRPFSGGSGGATDSLGAYLNKSYNWGFNQCYFEDQDYAIRLNDNCNHNTVSSCWFAPGSAGLSKVGIKGTNSYGNVFIDIQQVPANATDVHVEVAAGNNYNSFLHSVGVNFIPGSILSDTTIFDDRPYADGTIKNFHGCLMQPAHGYVENISEGSARGQITGIGTATATAYLVGVGEMQLGNGITGATTITAFDGLRAGQIFSITNYQNSHTVTIQGSGLSTGAIRLTGGTAAMSDYGQSITFKVSGQLKAYEIGRNF